MLNRISHTTQTDTRTLEQRAMDHARNLDVNAGPLTVQRWAVVAQRLIEELAPKGKPNDGYVKPHPLGVTPKSNHNNARSQDLLQAIYRFTAQSLPVPTEWVDELAELLKGNV